jgi:hypothetical protein
MRRARPLLSAELVLLLGLLALVGVGTLIERWIMSGASTSVGAIPALLIAALPALIWILGLRAHEGELGIANSSIALLFALGAFIAGPSARFAVERALADHPLVAPSLAMVGPAQILVAIGVVGLSYEAAKYLAVRYTAYHHGHGDPLTLLIAATAVALGVAAHDVYRELSSIGAIPLGLGATRAAAIPLAHAACAAVTACALIAVRTRRWSTPRRAAVLVAGIAVAAAMHGGLLLAHAALEADELRAHPGQAAAAVAVAAAALLVGLTLAAARLVAPPAPASDEDDDGGDDDDGEPETLEGAQTKP